jgi:hypothetical protein
MLFQLSTHSFLEWGVRLITRPSRDAHLARFCKAQETLQGRDTAPFSSIKIDII